jgi:hypothetical protein
MLLIQGRPTSATWDHVRPQSARKVKVDPAQYKLAAKEKRNQLLACSRCNIMKGDDQTATLQHLELALTIYIAWATSEKARLKRDPTS